MLAEMILSFMLVPFVFIIAVYMVVLVRVETKAVQFGGEIQPSGRGTFL